MIIEADNKLNKKVHADVNDELKLHIYTDNGIYSADSKVFGGFKTRQIDRIRYRLPSIANISTPRVVLRADLTVDFKMDIKLPDGSNKLVSATTKNICGKGMSYVADKPFLRI